MLEEHLPDYDADTLDPDAETSPGGDVLMRVESLRLLLLDTPEVAPLVLDVRNPFAGPGQAAYDAGHLPGAVYVDLETELSDPPADPVDERGRHPLPSPERFVAAMRRVGVGAPRANPWVVVQDEGHGAFASRLWWLLRDYGFDRVQVLSGGLAEWERLGGALSTETVVPEGSDWTGSPGAMPVVDADRAARLPGAGGVLIDARAAERYAGVTEPIDPVAGHIPGAVNVPFTDLLDRWGKLGSPTAVREHLASVVGRDLACQTDTGEVAAYCGSGVTATHTVLALAHAGIGAALYPPSWSGWIADRAHPVATGEGP